jgi:glutamate dehydrogenase (NAD(P)+)
MAYPVLRIHYRDPREGWEGMLVIDSLVDGVAIGGCRVGPSVDIGEVSRLAAAMTRKNRVLGLHVGGAKSALAIDPARVDKRAALERFFAHIRPIVRETYAFGPDLNTTGEELDDVARAIGLEWRLGASAPPAQRAEARRRYDAALALPWGPFTVGYTRTGVGAAACAERAAAVLGLGRSLRVSLHGFGVVGCSAAWALQEQGHRIVAVADAGGGYALQSGLAFADLLEARSAGQGVIDPRLLPSSVKRIEADEVVTEPADVLVLAATPDVVTESRAERVQARLVVEAGNIAVTPAAVLALQRRGIPVIPDSIASGGAVAIAVKVPRGDWVHDDAQRLVRQLTTELGEAAERVLEEARRRGVPLQEVIEPSA